LPPSDPIVRYGRYGALAFEFSGTIAAGSVVGWLIDRSLGSEPWGLVVCTLLAVVGGFIRLITVVRRFERHDLGREP
jgi:F0F1-type ATP synthase assembly protein I